MASDKQTTPPAYTPLDALLDAAERVFNKYGAKTDWTEWRDLRDALVAHGREPLPMDTPDGE